jgi:hypothetical protein
MIENHEAINQLFPGKSKSAGNAGNHHSLMVSQNVFPQPNL